MCFLIVFSIKTLYVLVHLERITVVKITNCVVHYDCEDNKQKPLHKYAINQVTQRESEQQHIESLNIAATLHSVARATTFTGYKFTAKFSQRKSIVHKFQTAIKTDSIFNPFIKVLSK